MIFSLKKRVSQLKKLIIKIKTTFFNEKEIFIESKIFQSN